jgi:hypothetical protein
MADTAIARSFDGLSRFIGSASPRPFLESGPVFRYGHCRHLTPVAISFGGQ